MDSFLKRYKDFVLHKLSAIKSSELFVFLFFLAVSFSFWMLQNLNESFEVEVAVPLKLEGVPENTCITTDLPSEFYVSLRDRGTSLVRFVRDKKLNDTVKLQFPQYDKGLISDRVQVPKSNLLRAVQEKLGSSTQLLASRPDTIAYYYTRGLRHRIPVKVRANITASPQHYVQRISTTPDSVYVYAASAVIDTMRSAYTQALTKQDLHENLNATVPLMTLPGVKFEPAEVKVHVSVGYYMEKKVEVPIIGINFPANKKLRTFPAKAVVTFRVGASDFNSITTDKFVLVATYEELLKNPDTKYRLQLKSLPEGVSNVRISPREVDYLIEELEETDEEVADDADE